MTLSSIRNRRLLWCAVGLALATTAYAGDEAKSQSAAQSWLQMMDKDGNGNVSAAECTTGSKTMFEKMDADRDGYITAKEMDAGHQKMAGAHGEKAGKGMHSSADQIKMVDADGDGSISAQEHETGAKKMFDKMDKDSSGTLSAAEIQAGHQMTSTGEH